jgi:3-hydroxyacyl-CoA dehydrogenase/enoyl-CoA hydratase/3-hydroxybutyryl-CoA epimerase
LDALIRQTVGEDGVLEAVIDMPGRSMNVFSPELMDALEALIGRVDRSAEIRSVVLTSGKSTFLAGADLAMIRGFTERARTATRDEMFELCGRLGRLFVRIEASPKPWIAAVNGTALGGGFELALACRLRIAGDRPRTALGVPEVRWGLLPGAGGTQRLPRLVGFDAALSLLLSGRVIDAAEALKLGAFDEVVPESELLSRARALARDEQARPYDMRLKYPHAEGADVPEYSLDATREIAGRHGVSQRDFELYPAYGAIVDSVLLGAGLPLDEATDVEMRQFLRLMFNPVAGNMVRTLFLNRQRADREWRSAPELDIAKIRHGEWSAGAEGWPEALAKSTLRCDADSRLPRDTVELEVPNGSTYRVEVLSLRVAVDRRIATPTAVLSAAGPYGRVLEIVAADQGVAAALAFLAARIGAVPYRTDGDVSALLRLAAATQRAPASPLDAQAVEALHLAARGLAPDVELFDVAACIAGVTAACAGGPFTHLWQHRDRLLPSLPPASRDAFASVLPRLEKAYA